MSATQIDLPWFRRHLLDEILPRWLGSACTATGMFLPRLDREWKRKGEPVGTIVSQGRLLYNFAVGYELTGDDRYLDAVKRGASFLIEYLYDEEHGGWFWSCDRDANIIDEWKDSYGHGSVVFGLAHAYSVTDDIVLHAMMTAAQAALALMIDEHAGIVPRMNRDFSARTDAAKPVNSQNPLMHLLEACLAANEIPAETAAGEVIQLITRRLFDRAERRPGEGLPELYTEDWHPLPTADGGRIDIGHQFEWAFLLSRAVELGLSDRYLDWAVQLLDHGLRVGYDPEEGGVFANASLEGKVIDHNKGWWQQCEALRALMHHAVLRGRSDLWEPFDKTLDYVRGHLIDPEYGGWYANEAKDKGNELKVDYHVVAMCEEAIRLAEMEDGV